MKPLIIINLALLLFCSCTKDFCPISGELSTGDAIKVSNTTAVANISVTTNSQTKEIGILYSTSSTPEHNNAIKDSTTNLSASNLTLRGLTAGTLYYYRAYASDGSHYTYGDIKQFTTTNHKIITVATGENYAFAIDETGTLWGWGYNNYGQLGNGTTNDYPIFNSIIIKEGTKFKAVATTISEHYSAAIDDSGNLWLWGSDYSRDFVYLTPTQVMSGTKFKTITAGQLSFLAIDEAGNMWCFGSDYPYASSIDKAKITPVQIKSGTKFKAVAVGGRHYLAIDESGNLWTWGDNGLGQLGCSLTISQSLDPIQIMPGTKFKIVSAAFAASFAIDELGNTWGWGDNYLLGTHPITGNPINVIDQPVKIEDHNYQTIATSSYCSVAIDEKGTLWGWGNIQESPYDKSIIPFINPADAIQLSNTKYKTIATGTYSAFAIDESGKLWGFGQTPLISSGRSRSSSIKPLTLINQF